MAKYRVLKEFRDKHTKEICKKGSIIDITVKRANEVVKNLDSSFLERIEESKEGV